MRNSASKDQRAIARERADTAKADRWVREAGHEPLPAAESSNPTERTGAKPQQHVRLLRQVALSGSREGGWQ